MWWGGGALLDHSRAGRPRGEEEGEGGGQGLDHDGRHSLACILFQYTLMFKYSSRKIAQSWKVCAMHIVHCIVLCDRRRNWEFCGYIEGSIPYCKF